jgi:hypothetical protein
MVNGLCFYGIWSAYAPMCWNMFMYTHTGVAQFDTYLVWSSPCGPPGWRLPVTGGRPADW